MASPEPSLVLQGLLGQRPEYKAAFETWTNELEPTLQTLEDTRRETIRKATARTAQIGGVVGLGTLILLFLTKGGAFFFIAIVAIVLTAIASSVSWLPLMSMKSKTKQLVVGSAAEAFGFKYDTLHPDVSSVADWRSAGEWIKVHGEQSAGQVFSGTKADDAPTPAFDILKSAKLLPGYDDLKFEDLIHGQRADASFSLVECKMTEERGSGKNRRTVTTFQGLLFHIAYPERFLGRTLIARDGWWKGFFGDKSLKKVDLVSIELEDNFDIYSDDQVEARALLTPDRMERLIALERHFKGGKMRGIFEGDHLTIALEADDQFEAGSIWKPLVDPSRYASALEEMGLVCDVIDGFLTREWVKSKL